MDSQSNSEEQIVVGLDIGTTKIACFVGRRNEHNKIEILGYGKSESVGVSRGVVANIEKTVSQFARQLMRHSARLAPKLSMSTSASPVNILKANKPEGSVRATIWNPKSAKSTLMRSSKTCTVRSCNPERRSFTCFLRNTP